VRGLLTGNRLPRMMEASPLAPRLVALVFFLLLRLLLTKQMGRNTLGNGRRLLFVLRRVAGKVLLAEEQCVLDICLDNLEIVFFRNRLVLRYVVLEKQLQPTLRAGKRRH
jgi:hypothetical protein